MRLAGAIPPAHVSHNQVIAQFDKIYAALSRRISLFLFFKYPRRRHQVSQKPAPSQIGVDRDDFVDRGIWRHLFAFASFT